MPKYKIGDTSHMTITDKETGAIIFDGEVSNYETNFNEFLGEYLRAKNSSNYEEDKDAIRNHLIRKYFMNNLEQCSKCGKYIDLVDSAYNEGMCKECYYENEIVED
jgi:hypothetical protein